eukprot:3936906-Rhodomonas_salina.2
MTVEGNRELVLTVDGRWDAQGSEVRRWRFDASSKGLARGESCTHDGINRSRKLHATQVDADVQTRNCSILVYCHRERGVAGHGTRVVDAEHLGDTDPKGVGPSAREIPGVTHGRVMLEGAGPSENAGVELQG